MGAAFCRGQQAATTLDAQYATARAKTEAQRSTIIPSVSGSTVALGQSPTAEQSPPPCSSSAATNWWTLQHALSSRIPATDRECQKKRLLHLRCAGMRICAAGFDSDSCDASSQPTPHRRRRASGTRTCFIRINSALTRRPKCPSCASLQRGASDLL